MGFTRMKNVLLHYEFSPKWEGGWNTCYFVCALFQKDISRAKIFFLKANLPMHILFETSNNEKKLVNY